MKIIIILPKDAGVSQARSALLEAVNSLSHDDIMKAENTEKEFTHGEDKAIMKLEFE